MTPLRLASVLALAASPALAQADLHERPGWVIQPTPHAYSALVERVNTAVEASALNVVTRASATVGAKNLGLTIPGNMVVGVFAPTFAVRMLEASVQAGIEAPLRLYVTENADGTATLSYRTASFVFAPYDEGGAELDALAIELDDILEQITAAVVAGN